MEVAISTGQASMTDQEKVNEQLIDTWQPVAAIAYRANLSCRRTLEILLRMTEMGLVKKTRVRLDGHNKVHLFKRITYTQVFSQRMPIDVPETENYLEEHTA
jgi:hypothetical protein